MKIAFYKAKHGSLLNKAINWCSGRDGYSHVEFQFSDGVFFGSSGEQGGVKFRVHDANPEHWEVIELRLNQSEEECLRDWCKRRVGMKYDWFGVLGFILPAKHMAHRWFCSAICYGGLERIGRLGQLPSWKVSPNELYLIVKAAKLCL